MSTITHAAGIVGSSSAVQPRNRKQELPSHPGKLLVADDEHLVASGMASNLRDFGYKVVGPAADGEEAIEIAEATRPDLALLDISMPKCTGLEAAEVIYHRLGIPVVIFSAFSDSQYVETCNEIGVFGYILKPVTEDQLRIGITMAWGRYLDHMKQADEVTGLKQRLEDRKLIEQAKWIIVSRKQISEPEAMKLLQRQARNNRRPLVEVARSVIENDALFSEE